MWRFLLAAAILTILIAGSAAAQIERNLGSRSRAVPLRPRQGERPRPPQTLKPQLPTAAQVAVARSIVVSCRGGARRIADRLALPKPEALPVPVKATVPAAPAAPPAAPSTQNVAEAPEAAGPAGKTVPAEASAEQKSRPGPLDEMAEASRRGRDKPGQTTAPEPPAKTKAEDGPAAPDTHAAGADEAAQAPAGESASGGGESGKGAAGGGDGAGQATPAAGAAESAKPADAGSAGAKEKPATGSAAQADEAKPATAAQEASAPADAPKAEGAAAGRTEASRSEPAARTTGTTAEEPPAEGRRSRRPNLIVTPRETESQKEEESPEGSADGSARHEETPAPAPAPEKSAGSAPEPPEPTPAQAPPAASEDGQAADGRSNEGGAADSAAKESDEAVQAGAEDARETLGWRRAHPPEQEPPPAEPPARGPSPRHSFDLPDTTLAQLDAGIAAAPKAEAGVFAALPAPSTVEPLILTALESPPAGSALSAGVTEQPNIELALPTGVLPSPRFELPRGLTEFSRGNHKRRQVALTFDDGPHPQFTSQLLAVLGYYDVPATFFVVGIQVQKYPQWLRMIHQAGHEIGSHTYDHFRITKLPASEKAYQVDELQSLVGGLVGVKPRFLRPPGGHLDGETTRFINSRGLAIALWDVSLNDLAGGRTSSGLLKSALTKVRPGSVILAHDGVQSTIDMLPELITKLRAEGYEFVTLSELAAGL